MRHPSCARFRRILSFREWCTPQLCQQRPQDRQRGKIDMRILLDPHRRAFHPVKHPEWQLQPTARNAAPEAASHTIAADPFDYLMNLDDKSCPRVPPVKNLAFRGPMGVPSSRCTTPSDRTLPWTTALLLLRLCRRRLRQPRHRALRRPATEWCRDTRSTNIPIGTLHWGAVRVAITSCADQTQRPFHR
jgi:hypothetical protein